MPARALVVLLLSGCAVEADDDGVFDTFDGSPDAEEPSACEDALDHIAACEGGQGESPYRVELDGDACDDRCVNRCIEAAPCEELAEYGGQVADTAGDADCPMYATELDACLYECRGGCDTPLAFSFDGAPIALGAPDGTFDFGPRGHRWTSWPGAANPWLVLDRDGDGTIDDASELFGDATPLPDGRTARNGFEALAALDADADGRLTPADPAWPRLALWSDDGDRASEPGELRPLDTRGIRALDLGFTVERRCDTWGNCEGERAPFTWIGPDGATRTGALVDVYLRTEVVPGA